MFLFQTMKRAIKPEVYARGVTTSILNDSEDEALKIALELSVMETDGRGSMNSNQTDEEDSDIIKATKLKGGCTENMNAS